MYKRKYEPNTAMAAIVTSKHIASFNKITNGANELCFITVLQANCANQDTMNPQNLIAPVTSRT